MTPRDAVPVLLKAHECRRIAVLAVVDPRTVARFFAGFPIRSTCEARIRQALATSAGPMGGAVAGTGEHVE